MESALFCSHLGALVGEGGETRSYRESDQKLDQAKSKALEIYFRTFCRKSNTKKLQSRVFTRGNVLIAPKMAHFVPKRNATFISGTTSPTLLRFLPLLPESIRANAVLAR